MSPQLQDALGMFAFLAIELSVLFIGISLLVGVLQRHIPPSKVEALLTSSGKRGRRTGRLVMIGWLSMDKASNERPLN